MLKKIISMGDMNVKREDSGTVLTSVGSCARAMMIAARKCRTAGGKHRDTDCWHCRQA